MLFRCVGACILAVVLLPAVSSAQVYSLPTPAPQVSAAGRGWYEQRAPILFAGDRYYPAGARFHFDADVMVPAGNFDGIPIYVDASVEPYSQILVPIGGGLVQPYERRRAGAFAGTTGSHAPGFPVEIVPWEDQPEDQAWTGRQAPPAREAPVEEGVAPRRSWNQEEDEARQQLLQPPGRIETVRAPEGNRGIWIQYEGQRWGISGRAVPFDAARFSKMGEYYGFPVFAARGSEEIYIPAARGMLAVYTKDVNKDVK